MSTIIGVFHDKDAAERALNEIRNAGITDDKISLVAKDDQQKQNNEEGRDNLDQNLTAGTATGGTLGGLSGLAVGAGALAIPGIGPIIAAGPIAAGLTGAAAGGIAGGLVDMGIPQDRGNYYEEQVKSGKILTAVEADDNKINDVASFLRDNGATDVETH